jgi:hypothetical protein
VYFNCFEAKQNEDSNIKIMAETHSGYLVLIQHAYFNRCKQILGKLL